MNQARLLVLLLLLTSGALLAAASEAPPPRCLERMEVGPCEALMYRFGYDSSSGACHRFVYGGCGANGNNFMTEAACRRYCLHQ